MEEGGSEERKKEDGERFSVIYRRVNQSRRTDPSLLVRLESFRRKVSTDMAFQIYRL